MAQPPDYLESESLEANDATNILEYLSVCLQRPWLILSCALAFGGAAAIWSYTQTPMYEASATVLIEPKDPKVIKTGIDQNFGKSKAQILTHINLMTSIPVLQEVADELNLSQRMEYQKKPSRMKRLIQGIQTPWLRNSLKWLMAFPKKAKLMVANAVQMVVGAGSDDKIKREMQVKFPQKEKKDLSIVKRFKGRVTIVPIEESKLVQVFVKSEVPEFAAHAANILAKVYIDRTLKKKSQFTEFASDWFASQLANLRKKVEESEQGLYAFRAQRGLVNVSNQVSTAAQRLAEQNKALILAERARTEAQTWFKQIDSIRDKVNFQENVERIDGSDWDSLTEVLKSNPVSSLRGQQISLLVELANLSEKYGPLHPKMIQAKIKLKELQTRMVEELDKVYGAVKNNYQLAVVREEVALETLKKRKAEKMALNKHAVQISLLEREANSNRKLYDSFLSQMSRADLSTQIQTSNMYVAEPAIPNRNPIFPKTTRNALMGLILGLLSGVGLVLFKEFGGQVLKGPRDLDRYLGDCLTLGLIPKSSQYAKSSKSKRKLAMLAEPMGMTANCYRHIRTRLWIATGSEPPFSMAITSPREGVGKTTLAADLAIALAQVDAVRVVLIDTDLRRPRLGSLFGLNEDKDKVKGLVQYLEGEVEASEILHDTSIPNLVVIPAGDVPIHPTEMLHSKKMQALLSWCKQQGFSVILDTPAALPLVDAMIVSQLVSSAILVVSAGETTKAEAVETVDQLKNHGINILGVVMQKVPVSNLPIYYQKSPYIVSKASKQSGSFWKKRI